MESRCSSAPPTARSQKRIWKNPSTAAGTRRPRTVMMVRRVAIVTSTMRRKKIKAAPIGAAISVSMYSTSHLFSDSGGARHLIGVLL